MERAKTEVEKRVSKLIKFIQNKNKITKDSKRELLGIVNDLQEQCQSLYSVFDDFDSINNGRSKGKSPVASPSSDMEYYSSDDIENVIDEGDTELLHSRKLEALRHEAEEKERELSSRVKELERELGNAKAECVQKRDLEKEIEMKASESKQLGEKNKGLRSQISGLQSVLKEKGDEISTLVNKFSNSELGLTSRIEELKSQLRNLEDEIGFLRARNTELAKKDEVKREKDKERVKELTDQVNGMRHELESLRSQKDESEAMMEKKVEEVIETEMQLKSLKEETEEERNRLTEEIEHLKGELAKKDEVKREKDKERVKELTDQVNGMRRELESLRSQKGESEAMLEKKVEEVIEIEMQLKSLKEETEGERNILIEEIEHLKGELAKKDEVKREEDKESVKELTDQVNGMRHELESLRSQKDESEAMLEKKVEEVTETEMQLKRLKEETEDERNRLKEEIKDLKGENQKLLTRIAELDSLNMEIETKNDDISQNESKILEIHVSDQKRHELESLRRQKDESEVIMLEKEVEEVIETEMQLKSLKEETEEERNRLNEEIDHLKGENQKLLTRIAELDSLNMEIETKNDDISQNESKILDIHVSDQKKLVKEQDEIIHRLSAKIKDQERVLKEQKDTIDKFSEDQKLSKKWSFGSSRDSKLNPNALERKMEELAEDFKMKIEDHIRILYRRIHVAEQIHLESKNEYIKTRDMVQEIRENRESLLFFKTHCSKMKVALEKGYTRSEMAMRKLAEAEEQMKRVARLAKEIDLVKLWASEKKSELETITAKLECREAQETLLKEKLSKLEKKLGEEGTEKLNLTKVLSKFETKIKELEKKVKGREVELLNLGEEKREAIRQLCVLLDYQRDRYDQLKISILKG